MRALLLSVTVLAAAACTSSTADGGGGSSCEPKAGQCPNICEHGTGVQGETCASPTDCECGQFCKGGSCAPYEGDKAGCVCEDVTPPATGGTTGGETGGATGGTTGGATGGATGGTTGGTTGPDINNCAKPAPTGAECNPYCQIGCTGGKQCTYSGGDFDCKNVGSKGIGEKCSGSSDCQAQMACFRLNEEPADSCHKFCIEDKECGADRKCDLTVNFSDGASASFCGDISVGCNAFDQTPCGEGQACYLSNNATKCMEAGTLELGDLCVVQGSNSCKAGLQCLIECAEVCSFIDVSDDEPKCTEFCEGGAFQAANEENGIGFCIGLEPPKACDLFEQTGCLSGEGCYMVPTGWRCITAGTTALGDACQFTNDCVPGSVCINSQCQEACSSAEGAPVDIACSEKCASFSQLTPEQWQIGICTDAEPAVPCDFWAQDCTEDGTACYFVSNGATCLATAKGAAEGESCQYITDCNGGLFCYQGSCIVPCSLNEFAPPPAKICVEVCSDFEPISFENQIGRCK